MRRLTTLTPLALLSGLLVGCTGDDRPDPDATALPERARLADAPVPVARALLTGPDGVDHGEVTFREIEGHVTREIEGHVTVEVKVVGAPEGKHAIHLHESGDCSASDFASAGGHFAPDGNPHGAPDDDRHHAGDFGNVTIDGSGTGSKELRTDAITVSAGPRSVLGRAVILHAGADDFTSQPAGSAGARIACGEVRLVDRNAGVPPADPNAYP